MSKGEGRERERQLTASELQNSTYQANLSGTPRQTNQYRRQQLPTLHKPKPWTPRSQYQQGKGGRGHEGRGTQAPGRGYRPAGEYKGANSTYATQGTKPSGILCNNCGLYGHRTYHCASPKTVCRKCHKLGHMMKFCFGGETPKPPNPERTGKPKDDTRSGPRSANKRERTTETIRANTAQTESPAELAMEYESDDNSDDYDAFIQHSRTLSALK
jgi:hypothetical protein